MVHVLTLSLKFTKISEGALSSFRGFINVRRSIRLFFVGIALWVLVTSVYFFEHTGNSSKCGVLSNLRTSADVQNSLESPFSGAFARFPRLSALPERQRRMTVVAVWNGEAFPSYLRHFFYTTQLNADVLDLLLIDRLKTPDDKCMDFDKAGVNITWGGNVKFVCMDNKEWKRRHVDFLCSEEYGWNCNPTEYEEVTKEYADRPDEKNFNWRPLRGLVFRDLFSNADTAFWSWMDLDAIAGNFARYPFNILSQLSILSGSPDRPNSVWMVGQLTAFNLDDKALGSAWKKFPEMKTADHFTKYIDGKMPESAEEKYWSDGYMRTDGNWPGSDLSYGIYSDLHGDDYFDGRWRRTNAKHTYVVSGRDILLVPTSYSRAEIEEVFKIERNEPIDDLGGLGWTGGEDGSAYILEQPHLEGSEAKRLALSEFEGRDQYLHQGIIDDQILLTNRSVGGKSNEYIPPHPLEMTDPPLMRATLLHFKDQQPGHIMRRLEKDQRPRGYERKLIRHYIRAKYLPWMDFPPFDITEDLVFRYNMDAAEVFRMGPTREETLFYRKEGKPSIG